MDHGHREELQYNYGMQFFLSRMIAISIRLWQLNLFIDIIMHNINTPVRCFAKLEVILKI